VRDLLLLAVAALLESFGYRQVNLVFRLRDMWRYFRKGSSWASAARAGFSKD
jgi:hypothetical protein